MDIAKEILIPYMAELNNFQFSYRNPVFWGALFILFVILSRFWQGKKAFSFCLLIGAVLLAATKTELYLMGIFEESLLPFLIRAGAVFLIAIIFIYYAIIRHS